MSIKDFIQLYKDDVIDPIIKKHARYAKINDQERRLWILNDERLYNFARSQGVRV